MAMSTTIRIDGVEEFRRTMTTFRKRVQTRIIKAAQRTVLSAAAKDIKSRIPSQHKLARAAIGWSLKRGRGDKAVVGKVGVGVGFSAKKRARYVAKHAAKGRSKKGVGIKADNLHWFILGTKPRYLKKGSERGPKAGHFTGAMRWDAGLRYVVSHSKITSPPWVMDLFGGRMRYLIAAEVSKMHLAAKAKQAFLDDVPF